MHSGGTLWNDSILFCGENRILEGRDSQWPGWRRFVVMPHTRFPRLSEVPLTGRMCACIECVCSDIECNAPTDLGGGKWCHLSSNVIYTRTGQR